MGKIDFDKFICALMEQESSKTDYNGIRNALKSCGYKYICGQLIELEPKFHEGDFVVIQETTYLISKIEGLNVALSLNGREGIFDMGVLRNAHLWTIQDAKNGDVLCYKDEISLYKRDIKFCTKQEITFGGFVCHYCYDGKRFITDGFYALTEQDKKDIHPATKEQRDLLFQKMHEAGYEWNADKKELKKIEQKFIEPDDIIEESYQQQADDLIDMVTEKPAWNEEDEMIALSIEQVMNCASLLNIVPEKIDKIRTWLKSLKDRVGCETNCATTKEWSEEDEKNFARVDYACLKVYGGDSYSSDWLRKFLGIHKKWKPSEEQMDALNDVIIHVKDSMFPSKNVLKKLYGQLKKLK